MQSAATSPARVQLPPGPRNALVETIRFIRDPLSLLCRYARRYGDPFTLPLLDGPMVITGDPALMRDIFSADPDLFDTSGTILKPLVGEASVFVTNGPAHRRKRKLLTPPMHSNRIRAYGERMLAVTNEHTRHWSGRVNLLATAQAVSLDVIIHAVFGVREPARVAHYRKVIEANIAAFTPMLLMLPVLRRGLYGHGPWSRYQRTREALIALAREEIRERRGQPASDDILSLLLDARDEEGAPMEDAEIVDELRTLLIGGHETTAVSLAWAGYELARNPEVQARLAEEVATLGSHPSPDDLVRLPYLGAVCDETLRIHPVAISVGRILNRPWRLGAYDLPAGLNLGAAMTIAHNDERLYPEPHRFRPERFLERRYSPFEFLPFGGGARRCLGAAFAGYELRVVIGTLIRKYHLELADERPIPTEFRGITLGPKGGVDLLCRARMAG